MRRPWHLGLAFALSTLTIALVACGDDTHIPPGPSATPFTTGSVAVTQDGNADVAIDTSSVTFTLDATRALVARMTVHSKDAKAVTIAIRGSVYDPGHQLVGDLTGGQINVEPGSTVNVQLSGPTPLGTIASATFEATAQPSPA